MFEKFKLTLTGAASHSFGRKTYIRAKPVVSDDQAEVTWAMEKAWEKKTESGKGSGRHLMSTIRLTELIISGSREILTKEKGGK